MVVVGIWTLKLDLKPHRRVTQLQWILSALVCLLPLHLAAIDIDAVEKEARDAYIDRWVQVFQDKNVMGKVRTPDGKIMQGTIKTRYDRDGGGKTHYHAFVTNHDKAYNVRQQVGEGENAKFETLFHFVSDHGKATGPGGASLLEIKDFELDKKFSKENEKNAEQIRQEEEQTGVKYRSMFKITTQAVFKDEPAAAANPNAAKAFDEVDKLEKTEIREEALPEIQKVGSDSAESILEAAKDKGFEKDPKTMPNLAMLYATAGAASEAFWAASLSNLGQRRANRGIRGGAVGRPQLSEDIPNCEIWAVEQGRVLNQQLAAENNPERAKAIQAELEIVKQQCKQITGINYSVINPRFEADPNGGQAGQPPKEVLKTGDLKKEDNIERDERIQLEMINRVGVNIEQIPSAWQYTKKDEQVTQTTYDNRGQVSGEKQTTMRETLEGFNQNIPLVKADYEEVRKKVPDLVIPPKLEAGVIQPGAKRLDAVNQPNSAMAEEFGLEALPIPQAAQSYEELLQQGQQN